MNVPISLAEDLSWLAHAGSIDYEEFIAATINLNRLEQEAAYLKAFQVFDTDNSGFLSIDEIEEALSVSLTPILFTLPVMLCNKVKWFILHC
jgi:Ca2+-binding EF-hand superfamily protein